jgi:hypothetical protein
MPFGWLHSIMLIPTYSIILNDDIIFDSHFFYLNPFFSEIQLEHKIRVWCIHPATTGMKTMALFIE